MAECFPIPLSPMRVPPPVRSAPGAGAYGAATGA